MTKQISARRPVYPLTLIGIGLLLMAGGIIYAVQQSPVISAATSTAPAQVQIPYANVPRIPLADAKAAYDAGQAVFLDVRGDPYYSTGHIPAALNIALAELEGRLGELDKISWIIIYCT